MNPTQQKRILMLLSNAFNPDPRVHREATALVRAGYEVSLLCWDRDVIEPRREMIDGIHVERVFVRSTHGRGATQMFFMCLFWIKALFQAIPLKFDVVHAHDFDTLPLGFILARLKRARLVYDSHESYVDMLHHLPGGVKRTITLLENFILKRTDLLITVGELLRDNLAKRGARRTTVVGNWQDPGKFVFDEGTISAGRKRFGIAAQQTVIVFIANLTAERQIPQLVEAVKESPDIFLILGGKGSCAGIAEEAAATCENIVYLGYVNPSEIPLYTALSDIVFYGFDPGNPNARFSAPNKLFEALAGGKAVMTGNFGEIGRIVKEHKCGVVLKDYSTESIRQALTWLGNGRRETLGEKAKTAGMVYTWKKAEDELVRVYNAL
jgi:glycosyltransferase involved in cell wall biosynthesis